MINTRQPMNRSRLRLLSGGRRSWIQRFWDVEQLFELKLTLLVLVTLVGASLGV